MPFRVAAYVGLGSNLGNRRRYLRDAIRLLRGLPGVKVTGISQVYETSPVGAGDSPPYLNAAVRVETIRPPGPLLCGLRGIERRLGRVRFGVKRNAPRPIDLDLLLHGTNIRRSSSLAVPHPRLHRRKFVLRPLLDLDPGLRHPVLRRTLASLLAGLPRSQRLRRVAP